ncbi:hypothetical protein KP79_PYT11242 [Mizuhopecten yessoensis]|uniref:Uncharacterized protein n=2 Tax=Mizuhopecten yessoensis TaxID=6573 RepID=A0A210R783_MIZYE|nr:hypothetical protein KP79_PYT11242 [Mizuhopecten yessoensis]
MLLAATATVVFFCHRRGNLQMFRSVPNRQTSEQLAIETPNNQLEATSQGMDEHDTPAIAVLCSQQNLNVKKISKLFIQFIKSKTEVLTMEGSCSGVEIDSYVHKWRSAQRPCTLLVVLSKDLLDALSKVKRGLDISKTPGLKLDLHLVNLLLEIDRVTPAQLPPVMLVCLFSDLCARYLELLPNLGQLYSIVDNIDQHKCQLRSRDLEQLFVSMSRGQLSPPVTLSHNSLTGCVQTKLLLAAIQELKNARPHQSKLPYNGCKPKLTKEMAMNATTYQCAYRPPGVARQEYVYRDLIRQGTTYFENGCVPRTPPTCCTGQSIDPRQPSQICVMDGSYQDNPRHALCESFSGQVDSGFDTMTTSAGPEEAENAPFVVRSQITAKSDKGMKKQTLNGTRQEEEVLFISPESDDECDGVSLSQRIVELNRRHTKQWNKP